MKEFACGDVVPGCDARITGADDDEVLRGVAAHASSGHGMTEVPAELVAQVQERIRTVG